VTQVADPFDPFFRHDPWPLYRELRETSPVFRAPDGMWVLTRYADVSRVLRDPSWSVDRTKLSAEAIAAQPDNPVYQGGIPLLLFLDPPAHTRLRSLVSKAFTPKVVEALRPRVQQIVDELLDAVVDRGRMDVLADLAYPLPVVVICELLGVPVDDRDRFHEWSSAASRLLDGELDEPTLQAGMLGAMQLIGYFSDLVEQRRAHPGDDLLSGLVAAEEEGERLSHEELLATTVLLFVAGHETTMNLIGNGTYQLLRHPEQLARLRQDPGLVPRAVEELLRFDGPVHLTARIPTRDVEIDGTRIAAGSRVAAVVSAANRDPAQFDRPDELDVGRSENRHLSFSAGPHFCLGAALARVEGQVALGSMLRRLDDLELLTEDVRYRDHFVLRGLEALEIGFSPA
jgi:cytochrome P450